MKLIDVAEFYSEQGGGVKTYIHQKLEAGSRFGVKTIIVAPGAEDRREERGAGTIIWVKAPRIPVDHRYHIFNKIAPILQVLDEEKPDVVEGSSPWIGGKAVAKWQTDVAKSFFIHQEPVSSYPQLLLENVLKPSQVDWLFGWFWRYWRNLSSAYDTSIVSSKWLADRFEGLGVRRPTVVPFGIDKSLFSPSLRNEEVRREMLAACGISDPNAPLILSISRHHPEKRIGTMIDAADKLNRKRPVGLYIIGDGPRRKAVEKHASKVPAVHVAGQIADRQRIATMLASADAMVHCCASETYGLVIAEALCSGLPLIVPDRGGAFDLSAPDYAESHKVGDADACAAAIERLLDRPQDPLRAAAAAAGKTIREPADHFEHLFRHYAEVSEKKRAGTAEKSPTDQ